MFRKMRNCIRISLKLQTFKFIRLYQTSSLTSLNIETLFILLSMLARLLLWFSSFPYFSLPSLFIFLSLFQLFLVLHLFSFIFSVEQCSTVVPTVSFFKAVLENFFFQLLNDSKAVKPVVAAVNPFSYISIHLKYVMDVMDLIKIAVRRTDM